MPHLNRAMNTTKTIVTIAAALVLLAVGLSAAQWVGVWFSPLRAAYLGRTSLELQPVNLCFQVKDQFGQPATDFRFRIQIDKQLWWRWVFPMWGARASVYTVRTDSHGIARFNPWFTRATIYHLEEVNNHDYLFPWNRNYFDATLEENPTGLFRHVPPPGSQECTQALRVLRHGPPVKLNGFAVGFNAQPIDDDFWVSIDLHKRTTAVGLHPADLLLHLRGAKTAGQVFWKQCPTFSLTLEGQNGTTFCPSQKEPPSFLTFAPESGYLTSLECRQTIDHSGMPIGFSGSRFPVNGWDVRTKSEGTRQVWEFKQSRPSLYLFLYVRTVKPRYFYWAELCLDNPKNDFWGLSGKADYNPDGSNNLYQEFKKVGSAR